MRCIPAQAVSSALLLLCLFAPHHSAESTANPETGSLLVIELYPSGTCDDEYIVIANTLGQTVNLRGWALDDGEGLLLFSADILIESHSEVSVSFNGSSYLSAYGRYPDIEVGCGSGVVIQSGVFRLADSGDGLSLLAPDGCSTDVVFYGQVEPVAPGWTSAAIPSPKKGEVLKRLSFENRYVDTNGSSDWTAFREYRYGYTELTPREFRVSAGNLTAYASPDCSQEVVLGAIQQAQETIAICSYELSSAGLCLSLSRAATRGVDVDVLVDGAPSGGMDRRQEDCLSFLAKSGADVFVVKGDLASGVVGHIGPMHAKYAVIDSKVTLIQSENFVESGLPADRVFGNRGWGIKVADASLAEFVHGLFRSDSNELRKDVTNWMLDARFDRSASLPEPFASGGSEGQFGPYISPEPASIMVYPSPDSSLAEPFLAGIINSARTIQVEQFQMDLHWKTRDNAQGFLNPLVSGLIRRMQSGASVRLLGDSTWFNLDRNMKVVTYLANISSELGLLGQFRLLDNSSPITVLHNKGMIIDSDTVLISSNNWVWSSFARNRELAACVLCPAVAGYFSEVFLSDWEPDDISPVADSGRDIQIISGTRLVLSANSSYDDRGIASYAWDVFADGRVDGQGPWIVFNASSPGIYLVRLTVEDYWGNEARDEVMVTVLAGDGHKPRESLSVERWLWVVPAMTGIIALLLRSMRKSRNSQP